MDQSGVFDTRGHINPCIYVLRSPSPSFFVDRAGILDVPMGLDPPGQNFHQLHIPVWIVVLSVAMNLLQFGVLVALFGFSLFHFYLLLGGMTTIEYCEKQRSARTINYSLGCWGDITQIFGHNPLLWLCPCQGAVLKTAPASVERLSAGGGRVVKGTLVQ